jgi:hypothetical protein
MAQGKQATGKSGVELVAGYRASGLARKSYCSRIGIPVTTLDYYLRRESERARKQARLVPVEIKPAETGSGLVLDLGGGMRVELRVGFDEDTLRRLLTVLR